MKWCRSYIIGVKFFSMLRVSSNYAPHHHSHNRSVVSFFLIFIDPFYFVIKNVILWLGRRLLTWRIIHSIIPCNFLNNTILLTLLWERVKGSNHASPSPWEDESFAKSRVFLVWVLVLVRIFWNYTFRMICLVWWS